jgi:GT2 family glycosyltransferase
VIVVENGSTDESDEILASYGKNIVVLKQEKNLGFAGGVNVGIRYALDKGIEYIGLFNNDAVAEEGWLEGLVGALQSAPKLGAIVGKILYIDGKHIDTTGDFYHISGIPFPRGRGEIDARQYDAYTNDIFSPCAGATLYRAEVFHDIGLFDETFFAYLEDVDLGFRLRLAGWEVRYAPDAVVYHHVSATSSRMGHFATSQYARNFLITYVKNMPTSLILKYGWRMVYRYMRMTAAKVVRGGLLAYLKGFLSFLRVLPYTLRERKRIQSSRRISSAALDKILWHGKPGQYKPPKWVEASHGTHRH